MLWAVLVRVIMILKNRVALQFLIAIVPVSFMSLSYAYITLSRHLRVTFLTRPTLVTLVKRVYGAWEHVYLPVLSFSIHIEQRHVNVTVLSIFWFKTVNNCDTYWVDNLNIPPIMFFVPNITFSGVRIFTRNIHLHCTDISDTGVHMFLRTNDKNN